MLIVSQLGLFGWCNGPEMGGHTHLWDGISHHRELFCFNRKPSMYKFVKLISDVNLFAINRLATFVRLGFKQNVEMLL